MMHDPASPYADEIYTENGVEYIVLYPVEKETGDEDED